MASDAELIGWSLAGDGEAFVEVVRRHEAAIGAYLARRAGREVAKDLLSEVWLAAFGSRTTYDRSYPNARPWLFRVATPFRFARERLPRQAHQALEALEDGADSHLASRQRLSKPARSDTTRRCGWKRSRDSDCTR